LQRHAAILADRKKITGAREARGIRCPGWARVAEYLATERVRLPLG